MATEPVKSLKREALYCDYLNRRSRLNFAYELQRDVLDDDYKVTQDPAYPDKCEALKNWFFAKSNAIDAEYNRANFTLDAGIAEPSAPKKG